MYRCQKLERMENTTTDKIRHQKGQDEFQNKKIKINGYKCRILHLGSER